MKAHGLFEKFQTQTDFHVRLEQESYEPLVIERHGELISVAHYFEQGGDLIADPDRMEPAASHAVSTAVDKADFSNVSTEFW